MPTAGLAARVLRALLSVGVLVGVGSGWYLQRQLRSATVTSNALTRVTPVPEGEPFTALLVGLDARTDATGNPLPPQLLDAMHAGPDEGQLHTDTMILLRVPGPVRRARPPRSPSRATPTSRSPASGGKHKINSAYRRGVEEAERGARRPGRHRAGTGSTGPRGRAAEADRLRGEPDRCGVDHYAELNLAGFVELTEALGGVPVCLNRAVRDPYSGIDLPAGEQMVSGADRAGLRPPAARAARAATWTASPASRPSPPAWPSACQAPAR